MKPKNKIHPKYTYVKDGVFYFCRVIPKDLEAHYSRPRFVKSLRTKSRQKASFAARHIASKLDDQWLGLRLANNPDPLEAIRRATPLEPDHGYPTSEDMLDIYVSVKGVNKGKLFRRHAERNTEYLEQCLGRRSLNQYATADAAAFRDWLFKKKLSSASVLRITGSLKAMFNFVINEQGLNCKNPFAKVFVPVDVERERRKPIPTETIRLLQTTCRDVNDDLRWLVALISDTGMRLSEAVGLRLSDIHLEEPVPYVSVAPHGSRSLKTSSSKRVIPLVGEALWASQQITIHQTTTYCFPRYCDERTCNSNSASAAVNKWLKTVVGQDYVIHSLRHSFRDRLRAIEAPIDLIDQLGGWSLKSVGQGYGKGYPLTNLQHWISKIDVALDHFKTL